MPEPLHRALLLILSRVIILLAFYREVSTLINIASIGLHEGLSALLTIVSHPNFLASLATSILALATFATGSIHLFGAAVILSTFVCGKPCLPLTQLILFIIYLVLDTIATGYRGLEHTSIKISFNEVVKSVPIPFLVVATSTLVAVGVTLVISLIISSFAKVPQANPQLYSIMTSAITKIIISLAALIYAFRVARMVAEITAIFIAPTSSAALAELLREDEIDVVFTPIFRWVLYIALAAVLYSPIYTMIFDILLSNVLSGLSDLIRVMISAVTYISLIFLSRSLDILSGIYGSEKRLAITSLVILTLAYTSATKLSFPHYGWGALLAPDFQGLGEAIQKSYIDFGTTVITLINALSRLVGAAP
jgi:hypothetical protein